MSGRGGGIAIRETRRWKEYQLETIYLAVMELSRARIIGAEGLSKVSSAGTIEMQTYVMKRIS